MGVYRELRRACEPLLHGASASVSLFGSWHIPRMPTFTTLGHCVYVLFSEADGKLYIGYSSNLKQRLITSTVGTRPQPPPAAPANLL